MLSGGREGRSGRDGEPGNVTAAPLSDRDFRSASPRRGSATALPRRANLAAATFPPAAERFAIPARRSGCPRRSVMLQKFCK